MLHINIPLETRGETMGKFGVSRYPFFGYLEQNIYDSQSCRRMIGKTSLKRRKGSVHNTS